MIFNCSFLYLNSPDSVLQIHKFHPYNVCWHASEVSKTTIWVGPNTPFYPGRRVNIMLLIYE